MEYLEGTKIRKNSVFKTLMCLKLAEKYISAEYISKKAGVNKESLKLILNHLLKEGSIIEVPSSSGKLYSYKTGYK